MPYIYYSGAFSKASNDHEFVGLDANVSGIPDFFVSYCSTFIMIRIKRFYSGKDLTRVLIMHMILTPTVEIKKKMIGERNPILSPLQPGFPVNYFAELRFFVAEVCDAIVFFILVVVPAFFSSVFSFLTGGSHIEEWDFKHFLAFSIV